MDKSSVHGLAKALAFAGGVISLLLGAVDLLVEAFSPVPIGILAEAFVRPVLSIAVGIVTLTLLNEIRNEGVAIVFVILGFVAGGTGGTLVGVAGLASLAAEYLLKEKHQLQSQVGSG